MSSSLLNQTLGSLLLQSAASSIRRNGWPGNRWTHNLAGGGGCFSRSHDFCRWSSDPFLLVSTLFKQDQTSIFHLISGKALKGVDFLPYLVSGERSWATRAQANILLQSISMFESSRGPDGQSITFTACTHFPKNVPIFTAFATMQWNCIYLGTWKLVLARTRACSSRKMWFYWHSQIKPAGDSKDEIGSNMHQQITMKCINRWETISVQHVGGVRHLLFLPLLTLT